MFKLASPSITREIPKEQIKYTENFTT